MTRHDEDCSRASHPSMCACAQVPSSHLAPADRYSALWWIVAFLGESYADFASISRKSEDSMPLKAGKNRRGLLSERPPKPATLYKSFSTLVGAYGRVADHARKAMFCRGPQKCIAERIEAKLRLAGAP